MFKIKLTKVIYLLSVSILLLGCSAHEVMHPPLFDVHQIENETGYFSEDESVGCSSAYVEFVQQEGSLFLFYTEISNNSEDTLIVYPQEIYLEVIKDFNDQNDQTSNRYFAIDPSHEIEVIDKQLKEESNRHDNSTAMNIFFGLFTTVVDLASDVENKGEAVVNDIFNTGANQVGEEIYHSDSKKSLNEIKNFWMNDILNEKYICPGDTARGLLYLPYSNTAETFKVVIPVCGFPDSFMFRQFQTNK